MRSFLLFLCVACCLGAAATAPAQTASTPPAASAAPPTEQYLRVCEFINRADQAFSGNEPATALPIYREAVRAMDAFRQQYAGWNQSLVELRVKHVGDRIKLLEQNPGAAALAPAAQSPSATPITPLTQPRSADVTNEFRLVLQELRAAEADNALLLAKLREALVSTPALLDPRELDRADQRIRALQAENESLRQQVATATGPSATASTTAGTPEVRRLRREIEDLNRKLKAQSDAAVQLLAEKTVELNRQTAQLQTLQSGQTAAPGPAVAALEQENAALRQQLAAANTTAAGTRETASQLAAAQARLSETQGRIESLQRELAVRPAASATAELARAAEENRTLQQEAAALRERSRTLEQQVAAAPSPGALAELRSRNEALQRDLAAVEARAKAAPTPGELAALRQRAETAEAGANSLRLENAALQQSVRAAAVAPTDTARVLELEARLHELETKLAAADREMAAPPSKRLEKRLDALNGEVIALRSRLNVYETKAVPFTKQELALFAKPASSRIVAAKSLPAKSSSRGMAAELQTRGEQQLAAGELPQAEQTLTQVVQVNEREIRALCNLANSQAGQGKLVEADATIERALALAPNDASSLAVQGYIRFSQGRYDDALNVLSRAASIKTKDPGIQVLLGVTLAEKGMRAQAETAFRKALQLQPNHADAHRNLAVIYLTQKPPRAELARWHYQKAVASGSPPSAELEREIETAATTSP
jgi:Flp pilus assembly protein TadD